MKFTFLSSDKSLFLKSSDVTRSFNLNVSVSAYTLRKVGVWRVALMRGEWCPPHGCSSCLLCSWWPFFISFRVRTAQSTAKHVEGQRKTNVFSATPDSSCMTTCAWVRWSTECTLDSPHAPFHSEVHFFNVDRYWWMWYWSGSVSRQHILLEHPWGLWMQRSVGFTFIINTHGLTLLITLFSFYFVILLFLQDVIRPVLAVWVEELPAVRNVLLVSGHQAWDA